MDITQRAWLMVHFDGLDTGLAKAVTAAVDQVSMVRLLENTQTY